MKTDFQSCTIKKSLEKTLPKDEVQNLRITEDDDEVKTYKEVLISSTPGSCRTPSPRNFNQTEMSPITRSTQRMSKAMQVLFIL